MAGAAESIQKAANGGCDPQGKRRLRRRFRAPIWLLGPQQTNDAAAFWHCGTEVQNAAALCELPGWPAYAPIAGSRFSTSLPSYPTGAEYAADQSETGEHQRRRLGNWSRLLADLNLPLGLGVFQAVKVRVRAIRRAA
jgi:hypothetical protein